jgi:hypothetical protein
MAIEEEELGGARGTSNRLALGASEVLIFFTTVSLLLAE